jgi:cytochrome b561
MKSSRGMQQIQLLKGAVVISGFLLIVAGLLLICMDVKGQGEISVDASVIKGKATATHIGVMVIFCGVVLQGVAILKTYAFRKSTRVIRSPEVTITEDDETGMCHSAGSGDEE